MTQNPEAPQAVFAPTTYASHLCSRRQPILRSPSLSNTKLQNSNQQETTIGDQWGWIENGSEVTTRLLKDAESSEMRGHFRFWLTSRDETRAP